MPDNRQPNILRALFVGATFGIGWMAILWVNAWLGFSWGLPKNAFEQSALFGDSFAPFVGFLTAAALLLAIRGNRQQSIQLGLQMEDLALTRKELKLTRDEMNGQRKAQERQVKVAELANRIAVERMKFDLRLSVAGWLESNPGEGVYGNVLDPDERELLANPSARLLEDRISKLDGLLADMEDPANAP